MKSVKIIGSVFAIIAVGGAVYALFFMPKNNMLDVLVDTDPKVIISSFAECIEAGLPVMESYPRQCAVGGKTFVEEVPSITYINASADKILIETPEPAAIVEQTLDVTGSARGNWFFEASFPIEVLDMSSNVLTTTIAQAQADWMTENFVPFLASISIPSDYTGPAIIVLRRNNVSGLPEYDASASFPVMIAGQ
jgi:hypothetical protein